jgi:hypothetical protein
MEETSPPRQGESTRGGTNSTGMLLKLPLSEEKYASCGTLSEGAEVESGGEVKAGVDDGVEWT